jgi:hypothetical protein
MNHGEHKTSEDDTVSSWPQERDPEWSDSGSHVVSLARYSRVPDLTEPTGELGRECLVACPAMLGVQATPAPVMPDCLPRWLHAYGMMAQ